MATVRENDDAGYWDRGMHAARTFGSYMIMLSDQDQGRAFQGFQVFDPVPVAQIAGKQKLVWALHDLIYLPVPV